MSFTVCGCLGFDLRS